MNSGYLFKRLVSVEVQDEERPTRPALLRSSASHTPYSNVTSGVLLLLLLLECVWDWKSECLRGMSGGPFYSLKGRFPPSLNMETCSTAFGKIRTNHRPKCTWTGANLGLAELVVRPAPLHRLWPPPLAEWLTGGSSSMYVGAGALYVGLLCQLGPLCKCDAGLAILCICIASFAHFILILRMGACKPRIIKTHGNG